MQVIEINENERDYWDEAIARFEIAHPLNAFGWGKVRAVDGWTPTYLMAKKEEDVTGAIMILTKYIPVGSLSIMYAPKGPVYDPNDELTLQILLERIREEAKKRRAIFIRIDPNIQEEVFNLQNDPFLKEGFIHLRDRWSFWNSPRDVYRIDLTKARNEEELFKSFEADARRCIRKAQREGVTIRPAESLEEFNTFYAIFKEFSFEKGFMVRGYNYQKCIWDEYIRTGKGRLFLAVYRGQIIGGSLCLIFARKCLGMHLGSPFKYRELKTNDVLEWESIKWAKKADCLWFSFRGIGPTPTQGRFKRKFGPDLVSLAGYYDLPFYPLLYCLFYTGEFKILPRTWKTLMKARKFYYDFANRLKGKGSK